MLIAVELPVATMAISFRARILDLLAQRVHHQGHDEGALLLPIAPPCLNAAKVIRDPFGIRLGGILQWFELAAFTWPRRPTPPYIASAGRIWFPNRSRQANADGQRPLVHQRQLHGSLRDADLELQGRVTRTQCPSQGNAART